MAQDEVVSKSVRANEMRQQGTTLSFYFAPMAAGEWLPLPHVLPPYWSPLRDAVLYQAYHMGGLWADAVNIACTRVAGLGYEVKGDIGLRVRQARTMLGRNWVDLMQAMARDYSCSDNGAFLQIVRATAGYGSKVLGFMYLPSSRCIRTGDAATPVVYTDALGKYHELKAHQVAAFSDMPNEDYWGAGLSAASRSYRALYRYSAVEQFISEKVTGRRPLAVDLVSGMSDDSINDVFRTAQADADAKGLMSYMGAAIKGNPNNVPISHVRIPLADLPNGFDWNQETELAQIKFATALGIDPVDLNPRLIGNRALGAGSQAQVLDEKANSKGLIALRQRLVEFFNDTERWHALPARVAFAFSERDLKDQQAKAGIAQTRAATRAAQVASGEITKEEARQLAVDAGDLPESFIQADSTPDETLTDEDKASEGSIEQAEAPVPPVERIDPALIATKALESLKAYATTLATLTLPTTRQSRNKEYWQEVTKAFDEVGRIWTVAARQEVPQDQGEMGRSIRYAVTNKNNAAVTLKLYAGNAERPEVAIRATLYGRKGFGPKAASVLRFRVGDKTVFAKKVAGSLANDWFGRSWQKVQPQVKEIEERLGVDVTARVIDVKDVAGAIKRTRLSQIRPPKK